MAKAKAKELYLELKKGGTKYKEELHCTLLLDVMETVGTMIGYCRIAKISQKTFYIWCKKHPIFNNCYELGRTISQANWEQEGRDNADNEDFNWSYWQMLGKVRYGAGLGKLRIDIEAEANPYQQYQQLIKQAGNEEFTASELKQVMESINVGRNAFETFKLQESVDAMKADIDRMNRNNEQHQGAATEIVKINTDSVCDKVCEPED